jgi:hypothetical protein
LIGSGDLSQRDRRTRAHTRYAVKRQRLVPVRHEEAAAD